MPVLKGIKVDEFENVTVLLLKDVSFRYRLFEGTEIVHISISDADKTEADVMVQCNETTSICESTATNNIDMIIDIPNKKNLRQFIDFLTEIEKEIK